ncbi:LrgB family protein [Paenibacillus plantiphilus]|nr:LrgB family protein [Paenibacillus plantiphilus]
MPLTAIIIIVLTIALYLLMSRIYKKFKLPFLVPVITTSFIIILILTGLHIPYDTFMIGGQWINLLLGPAVVSLAYPLYKQRTQLMQNAVPILSGVIVGSVVGMVTGLAFAELLGVTKQILYTLLPKSITTPVAIQIADELGGISSLAASFVMIAGFTGLILGPLTFKLCRIDSMIGRGIGLGSASHAIGTVKAIEYGEQAVSMSSVAMTICALVGSLLAPLIVWFL